MSRPPSSFKNILRGVHQVLVWDARERIRAAARELDPKSLIPFGHKVFCQCDEDGIIREIFRRIDVTNRMFVEVGVGHGLENNTLALVFDGWQGLWMDASARSIRKINRGFAEMIESGRLTVEKAFVSRANVNELISAHISDDQIDLLSIDIDGNDYHVFDAIRCVRPRVVILEYNAKFAPPIRWCMGYDESHVWRKDDCFGASLKFLEVALGEKGYRLVSCNVTGINAFFVREDLVGDKFSEPFTAEHHFQPARYFLSRFASGHPPSYKTLAKSHVE